MNREEAIKEIKEYRCVSTEYDTAFDIALDMAIKALEQEPILDKIRTEIEQEIEQEKVARSVFRGENGEKKDAVKAEQCTGSIYAYRNVIKFIDNTMQKMRNKE